MNSALPEQVNAITGGYGNVKGSARPASSDGRAEFIVGFSGIPFGNEDGGTEPNYRVVATDYTTYAIVYDCSQKLFIKKESLWLLTRDQNPSPYIVAGAKNQMKSLGLPVGALRTTPQTNASKCPQLARPTLQSPSRVWEDDRINCNCFRVNH